MKCAFLARIACAWLAGCGLVWALAAPAQAEPVSFTNPVIKQRADTAIIRHTDGYYYMTASVPDYKRVELRRASTLQGLADAAAITAFAAPASGALGGYLWAPDIRFYDGAWYLYFSGAPSSAPFAQRLYWMRNEAANPMTGTWSAPARLLTGWDSFALDATSFEQDGVRYLVWAQSEPGISSNSNLYIARMNGATAITGSPVRIAVPTLAWEKEGYAVNEGPQVLQRNGRVFIAYSASATDARYKMGLLSAAAGADMLQATSWVKRASPVFATANGVYGPGHGSFTVAEDGVTDIQVYHARDYDPPTPDALTDPNRHTRMQPLLWTETGEPFFGQPAPNGLTPNVIQGQYSAKCLDDYQWNTAAGAPVRLWDCDGYSVQKFAFEPVSGNAYRIVNQNSGTCLEDPYASQAIGTDVVLSPCNGSAAQQWTLRDSGDGWFQLYNVAAGLCLDNWAWDRSNGARVSLYTCNGNAVQRWRGQ